MIVAALVWGAPGWLPAAASLFAVTAVLVLWSYARSPAPIAVRVAAAALKAAGVALLAVCLLEPLYSGSRARPGANQFVILADNSQSLDFRDARASQTRGETMQDLLAAKSAWQTRLAQDFDVRRYQFDARLRSVADFDDLTVDGAASSLATSLATVARRYRGRPLAGVLVFTDGNATDRLDQLAAEAGLPPIYPVLVGDDAPARDVSLVHASASQTSFEDAPVSIQAEVDTSGYTGRTLVAQLLDDRGKTVDTQRAEVADESKPLVFRFQAKPDRAGVSFYTVRAAAEDELAQFDAPDRLVEATLANNQRMVVVDRGGGPYRVLYVCGRPNWEFKFLNRALYDDEQVELVGLMRIAKREPKFDYRGRVGESTNPLFRGFGNQGDEEAERYDQPVLVRLGTKDADELRDGFPKTADVLFEYDAIVIDDVEAEFFTQDQMSLVEDFVADRGGGFLMLGGQESFAAGKYHRTAIGEMLPVYLDRAVDAGPVAGFRLDITRDGWLQPWVRLRANEVDERKRLDAMPGFHTLHAMPDLKPGAMVLSTATTVDGKTLPAVAVQRFGKGRAGAVLLGDLWRWAMRRESDEPKDLEKAWRQMIRWLVSDIPQRIELAAEHENDDPAAPVRLAVTVRDAEFAALDNAVVKLTVTAPDGKTLQLDADASQRQAGVYEAAYMPRLAGAYRVVATVAAPDGSALGERACGWTADPAADEFRELAPNVEWMSRIAAATGGELVAADRLAAFVADLPNRKAPITEVWVYPLWHTLAVFLAGIVCLAGEWGLRRMNGLP